VLHTSGFMALAPPNEPVKKPARCSVQRAGMQLQMSVWVTPRSRRRYPRTQWPGSMRQPLPAGCQPCATQR
jgi:hypothetical protein